jgi:hypothetical protein
MANGLAALLAKRATEKKGEAVSDSAVPAESATVPSGEPESATVPRETAAAPAATQRPANPFAKRQGGRSADSSGHAVGGSDAGGGSAGGDSQPRPALASVRVQSDSQPVADNSSRVESNAVLSLDDLAASSDPGIAPRQGIAGLSHFQDETPATKPTRELPEGLDKDQLGFVDLVDSIYDVMHEPDLMGGAIRNIIIELKSHPEYMKLVAPDDIRVWVRGMRSAMGLAKIKKAETKAKRGTGGSRKSKLVDMDMLADLEALGVDIPE